MKFCVHNERKTIMLDVLLLSNFLLFFCFVLVRILIPVRIFQLKDMT